jgi:hypothetical protein
MALLGERRLNIDVGGVGGEALHARLGEYGIPEEVLRAALEAASEVSERAAAEAVAALHDKTAKAREGFVTTVGMWEGAYNTIAPGLERLNGGRETALQRFRTMSHGVLMAATACQVLIPEARSINERPFVPPFGLKQAAAAAFAHGEMSSVGFDRKREADMAWLLAEAGVSTHGVLQYLGQAARRNGVMDLPLAIDYPGVFSEMSDALRQYPGAHDGIAGVIVGDVGKELQLFNMDELNRA